MDLIRFKHPIAGRTVDGDVLVALIGGDVDAERLTCVGLLLCKPEAATALIEGVGSALKDGQ